MVALVGIVLTLITWLAARRVERAAALGAQRSRSSPRSERVAQIPLGGLTVLLDLHPVAVMSHFLLALLVARRSRSSSRSRPGATRVASPAPAGPALAAGRRARSVSPPARRSSSPARWRPPRARIPAAEDIRRLGLGITDTVYVHVRATAVFGIGLLVVGVFLWRLRARAARGSPARPAVLLGVLLVADGRRRGSVPQRPAVVARRHPRLARGDDLGADRRDRLLAAPAAHLARGPRTRLTRDASARLGMSSMESELRIDERPTLRRPGPDRGLPRLERRRPGRNARGRRRSPAPGMRSASPRSTRRDSSTSRRRARPVSLDEGMTRHIEWPENGVSRGRDPRCRPRRRDPARRRAELPLATRSTSSSSGSPRDLGVELVVTLGALLADVPHTRAAPVTGAASDLSLVEELGLQPSRYEGPTGIVGVLHDACRQAGIPSVSLWSAVPHYVSLAPSPRAARALCDRLGELLGVTIDVAELEEAEEIYAEQITEAVASDPETAAYVEELERRADTIERADRGGRPPDWRVARGRADAVPARPRERRDPPASGGQPPVS